MSINKSPYIYMRVSIDPHIYVYMYMYMRKRERVREKDSFYKFCYFREPSLIHIQIPDSHSQLFVQYPPPKSLNTLPASQAECPRS